MVLEASTAKLASALYHSRNVPAILQMVHVAIKVMTHLQLTIVVLSPRVFLGHSEAVDDESFWRQLTAGRFLGLICTLNALLLRLACVLRGLLLNSQHEAIHSLLTVEFEVNLLCTSL